MSARFTFGLRFGAGVFAAALVALLAGAGPALAQIREVLPPQRAFPYTVEATAEHLVLEFAVLDGYYLYRDKFGFGTETPGVTLRRPIFPDGEIHTDEYFGEQVIFRNAFEIRVPYRRSGDVRELELDLRLQGCADAGLC